MAKASKTVCSETEKANDETRRSSVAGLIGEPIPAGSSPKSSPEGGGDPIVFELVGEAGNSDERDGDQRRVVPWPNRPVNGTAPHRGWRDSWPSASPPEPRQIDSTNSPASMQVAIGPSELGEDEFKYYVC